LQKSLLGSDFDKSDLVKLKKPKAAPLYDARITDDEDSDSEYESNSIDSDETIEERSRTKKQTLPYKTSLVYSQTCFPPSPPRCKTRGLRPVIYKPLQIKNQLPWLTCSELTDDTKVLYLLESFGFFYVLCENL